ncbi:hypothetical protein EIP86_004966 [Pleurotus ostreatoroseus]|nr:hypothetical protein EIP86_004966 [Pleurotus ostreatoroseus]
MRTDLALASPFNFGRPFSTPGPFVATIPPLLHTDINSGAFSYNQSRSPTTRYLEDVATHAHHAISHSPHPRPESFIRTTPPVVHQQTFEANTAVSSPKRESSPPPLHTRYKVYFDSPMEDPFGSDPLEPPQYELDLDYSNLDFHWTKFDRSNESDDRITQQASVEDTMTKAPLIENAAYFDRLTSPQIDALSTDQTLHVEDVDTESDPSGDASDPSTIGKYPPDHSPTFEDDNIPTVLKQGTTELEVEPDISRKARDLSDAAAIPSTQPDAQVENSAKLMPTSSKETADLTGVNRLELHISESPPKTPVNQIGSALPRTPPLRRKAIARYRSTSVPQIAVLKQESEEEDEVLSEPKLSQVSHDTIESWSAP